MNLPALLRPHLLARVLAALLASTTACAQGVPGMVLQYKVPGYNKQPVAVAMPYVQLPRADVAEAINLQLHHLLLGTLAPAPAAAMAAGTKDLVPPGGNDWTEGLSEMTVRAPALLNGGRVLAVAVEAEGCGAYCENYSRNFAFDARSGRRLVMQELLIPGGMAALARLARAEYRRAVQQALAGVQRELRKKPADKDLQDTLEAQQALYQECAERYATEASTTPGAIDLAPPAVTQHALAFTAGRCSNHAMRALDDLGDITWVAQAGTLRPHLTPYGRAVVLEEGDAAPPALNPFSQVFKGSIAGRLPVTLFFDTGDADDRADAMPFAHATYYYQRYGRPIPLAVKQEAGVWTLTEDAPEPFPGAKAVTSAMAPAAFTVRLQGGTLSGQWRGGGKTLPFAAQAFPASAPR